MKIYFITGNKNKFEEARAILGDDLEQLDVDLPEIQHIDPHEIIKEKLQAAFAHHKGPFIVDDVSVDMAALNGLPGPLIKWFLQALGDRGIYKLAEKLGNKKVKVRALVGYAKNVDNIHFFEGVIEGQLVEPRGEYAFGWDPIFEPKDSKKTYAEMGIEEKNKISHRRLALDKLKEFLENLENGKR